MSEDKVPMDSNTAFFAEPAKGGHVEPYGIVFDCNWAHPTDSFGQVSRRTIRAIMSEGMPVSVRMDASIGMSLGGDYDPSVLGEIGCSLDMNAMLERDKKYVARGETPPNKLIYNLDGPLGVSLRRILVSVHHLMPNHYYLRKRLNLESARFSDRAKVEALHRYKILMTALETDRIPEVDAREVSRFGQVWVPCADNAKALVRSGVDEKKIRVVPHPILPADEARLLATRRRNAKSRDMYTFYNIGKWEPRKNQVDLMAAFLLAFSPDDDVRLVVKTSRYGQWKDYPETPEDALSMLLGSPLVAERGWNSENVYSHLIINTNVLSNSEMVTLHGLGDCYVTASHGEGWDMPLFDAMVAGSYLITTKGGGEAEYSAGAKVTRIECDTEVAHRGYNLGHSRWLKVDRHHVRDAMVDAFRHRKTGVSHRPASCTLGNVGKICIQNVLELCGLDEDKLNAMREAP